MPDRPDEEGYIAYWDARLGRGHIRAALPAPAMLPFSRDDLQPTALQPRLGMAVRFTRRSGPSGDQALTVRPWVPDEVPPGGSARRSRRPVFQATGAAPLGALPIDPLQGESGPGERRLRHTDRADPKQGSASPRYDLDAALDEPGPQPTRPAPLTPVATLAGSGGRTGRRPRRALPRRLWIATLAIVLATGLGLLLGIFGSRG